MLLQIPSDSQNTAQSSAPVRTSEDWVVLDSGKSFAWSAQQQGSHREQLGALRKLLEQQQQQVDTDNAFITLGNSLTYPCALTSNPILLVVIANSMLFSSMHKQASAVRLAWLSISCELLQC